MNKIMIKNVPYLNYLFIYALEIIKASLNFFSTNNI